MHRYTLQAYAGLKSRYTCPQCRHRQKTFKLYIDTRTNTPLASHVGRCDRADSCGYHYTPREFFKATPGFVNLHAVAKAISPKRSYNLMPHSLMQASMCNYSHNNFVYFLSRMFGRQKALSLAKKYNIGTAKHWPGANIFWQVDVQGNVRTGKIMLYNTQNCKRVKEPYNHIAWAHRLAGSSRLATVQTANPQAKNFDLKQCLYGEHLLALDPWKPVAIAESEKTAIIASEYKPQYIWLAAGSLDGLTADKCRILKNRTVTLYPDVNGYAKWQKKARLLNTYIPSATFTLSHQLETTATPNERAQGVDIADRWVGDLIREWMAERGS